MPLKPMFSRAPLTRQPFAPLSPEHVRLEGAAAETLNRLCALAACAPMSAELAAGALACAYLQHHEELAEKTEKWVRVQLSAQAENGSLPGSTSDNVKLLLAAARLYAHTGEKPLLEQMMRYCAFLRKHWDDVRLDGSVMAQAADLMELLVFLYNVTGKKALTSLMELTRQSAMDWSGLLTTFAMSRPTGKGMDAEELAQGRSAEGNDPSGFYTRQYYATFGPAVAQGMRLAALNGLFSGSARDMDAGVTGYEKVMRYHGTACGAFTSDLHLAGGSPSAAVSAWAAGETLRAMAKNWQITGKPEAAAAMARLMINAVPAFLPEGKLLPFLRMNSLSVNCGTRDCFAPGEPEQVTRESLGALLNGFAAAAQSAVTVSEDGFCVAMPLPGTYKLRLKGEKAKLHATAAGEKTVLTLEMEDAADVAVKLYIPAWAKDACVEVNDEGGDAPETGKVFTLHHKLRDGDHITLLFPRTIRTEEGYHQSESVLNGDTLLALPVSEDNWRVALTGVKEDSTAELVQVAEWNTRVHTPADPPIAPKTTGEGYEAALAPFAETPCRVAAFPKGKRA